MRGRNYGFERRRKQDARQAKQETRRQRKASRLQSGVAGPEMGEPQDSGARPETWEWFSPSRGRTIASDVGLRPETDPPDDWVLLTDVDPSDGHDHDEEGRD